MEQEPSDGNCIPNELGLTLVTEEKRQAAIKFAASLGKFNELLRRCDAMGQWFEESQPSLHDLTPEDEEFVYRRVN